MSKYDGIKRTIFLATMFGLMPILGGCGGSDEKKNDDDACYDNIVIFFICAALSSEDPGTTGKSSTDSGVASKATAIASFDEFEPNNVLSNANVVTFPKGAELTGSVRSGEDNTDFFIFTPDQSGLHRIYLCADTCADSLEGDATYIMIFDQNQTTVASTPVGTMARQEVVADLTAGLAYYVEVNGYNAGEERYDYRLAVVN